MEGDNIIDFLAGVDVASLCLITLSLEWREKFP